MSSVMSLALYRVLRHSARLSTFTAASWSLRGLLPPEDKVPQPVIQQLEPGAMSLVGRHTVPTQPFISMGLSNLIRPMSFSTVRLLYRGWSTHLAERRICSLPLVRLVFHSPA